MCGVSGAEKTSANNLTNLAGNVNQFFQDTFKNNNNILSSLKSVYEPIIAKGINQFGLQQPEEHALRTNAADTNQAAGQQTTDAVRQQMATQGGGGSGVSNGGQAVINASLGTEQAGQEAQSQEAITQYGYDIGRQNFLTAENALAAAPGELENPETNAGMAAEEAATANLQGQNQERQTATAWEAPVAGMIGKIGAAATAAA